jgi:hypothetical protein
MPRNETTDSTPNAKKVVLPRVKFVGQQPGEEGVEQDNDDDKKRVKEPSEIPPRPPKGEPPYRKL